MKFHPVIILFFLCLTAAPAGQIRACGSDHDDRNEQPPAECAVETCGAKTEFQLTDVEGPESCCDHQNSGRGCPCDPENGGCRCPGGGMICHSGTTWAATNHFPLFNNTFIVSVQKMAFYFAFHMPEAVYLPIWHPPKVVA